jgi:hypothetical protein
VRLRSDYGGKNSGGGRGGHEKTFDYLGAAVLFEDDNEVAQLFELLLCFGFLMRSN